jgi:NAD(P)-dependent dehydrogenase (short-subunit alcohol dehydrogenase family)
VERALTPVVPPAAVVIGAASGMGEAVAQRLAAEGHRLVLADRRIDGLTAPATDLGVEVVVCDITDTESVDQLAAAAGETSALVVTAGLSPTMGTFAQIVDVNLAGMARVLRAFESRMVDGGVAVCFASIAGHMAGNPSDELLAALDDPEAPSLAERIAASAGSDDPGTAYSASKLGVLRLARRTAKAWATHGVRVCSLSPGIIDTPMGRQELEQQPIMAEMIKATPAGRMGRADEIAEVVAFLCSAGASYMTACDVLVDGGFVGGT